MKSRSRFVRTLLFAAALTSFAFGTACAHIITTVSMTPTTTTTTSGTTTKWSITISGRTNIIAIPIAIFASCLQRSKKNTGTGATVTASPTKIVATPGAHSFLFARHAKRIL